MIRVTRILAMVVLLPLNHVTIPIPNDRATRQANSVQSAQ